MKDKTIFIIVSIILVILLVLQQWLIQDKQPDNNFNLIYEKLDRIEKRLDSLSNKKDSIRVIIETIDNKIIENQQHYEKVVNNIITQPSFMDSIYVIEYVDRFIESESFSNYMRSTRTNEHWKSIVKG